MADQQIAFVFPGQGAQVVGMGKSLHDQYAEVRSLFAQAADILGYDIGKICFEGPAQVLNETKHSQPALFLCSLAAVEALRVEGNPWLDAVTMAAGLSLGEYTAVCFAGGVSFEDGLRLVQRRGEAMQAAADLVDSGMASVLGMDLDAVTALCDAVRREGEVLQPANILCPGNIAISGHKAALARLEPAALDAGAMKVIPLAVAGAFHTLLMQPAVDRLADALGQATLRNTRLPVFSNVDAKPHYDGGEISDLLARQVVSPVQWDQSVRQMITAGCTQFIEVGTGKVLRGTIKRIDRKFPTDGFGD